MLSYKPLLRNKFESLLLHKHHLRKKVSRFSRKSLNEEDAYQIMDRSLLEKNSVIEMATMSSLPPQWVDQFEQCTNILGEVQSIKKEIVQLYYKKVAFNEKEQKQRQRLIYKYVCDATAKIRICEGILKTIREAQKSSKSDEILCKNMCQAIAMEAQQKARELRTQQRKYIDQKKKLDSASKVSFLELAASKQLSGENQEQLLEYDSVSQLEINSRTEEIQKLVKALSDLNTIYKQLNSMVILQGTLLDRIDFNIDTTLQNTTKAKQNLTQALQHQESPLAGRCIKVLITVILVLAIIMIIKYSR